MTQRGRYNRRVSAADLSCLRTRASKDRGKRRTGRAAPSTGSIPLGRTIAADWLHRTYSAYAPFSSLAVPWTKVATRSPALMCLTAEPTEMTSPAESQPTTVGGEATREGRKYRLGQEQGEVEELGRKAQQNRQGREKERTELGSLGKPGTESVLPVRLVKG
jgi:hypothetical protein